MKLIIPSVSELTAIKATNHANYLKELEHKVELFINNDVRHALLDSEVSKCIDIVLPDIGQRNSNDFLAFCLAPLQELGYNASIVKGVRQFLRLTW